MAETDFKYDVFVSYSSANKEWVRKTFVPALENAGLRVCDYYRDFDVGAPIVKEMERAILESRKTILVLSPAYLKSGWTEFENLMLQTLDAANQEHRLLPVIYEKCDLPLRFRYMNCANFDHPDDVKVEWQRLFKALGKPETFKPSNLQPETHWFYGHRYGDLATFTGRAAEMQMLDDWLANDYEALLVLRALGGFGKSALTWQWFNHRVDKTKWQTAVWWSFYEKESGFESFLAETLNHLGVEVKASARSQLNDLLEAMRGTNILIVLDGFERLLRQYGRMDAALQYDDEDAEIDPSQRDCSSPLTETFLCGLSGAGMKSKVLLTTRLCPRVLESADGKLLKGCREEPLAAFAPEDAVTYFHNEGVKATRTEVIETCAAYGYHPLSLSLLVGLINADHEQRGDIAAVKNLQIFADVKARRHHVLERAYGSLAPERRDLLSKMSCFRGSMEYAVLKKVFPSPDLDKALLDLRKRGLLQYVSPLLVGAPFGDDKGAGVRYDMHPIVRHYAYDLLSNKQRNHRDIAEYLLNSIIETEGESPENISIMFDKILHLVKNEQNHVSSFDDLSILIELYYHVFLAGEQMLADLLFEKRLYRPLLHQFCYYTQIIEIISTPMEGRQSNWDLESRPFFILGALSNAYAMSGQSNLAIKLAEKINLLFEDDNSEMSRSNLPVGLLNIGNDYLRVGAIRKAEASIRRSITLYQEISDSHGEAYARNILGKILLYLGRWGEANQELDLSEEYWINTGDLQGLCITYADKVLYHILATRDMEMMKVDEKMSVIEKLLRINRAQRTNFRRKQVMQKYALPFGLRSLKCAEGEKEFGDPSEGDFVIAHWLLGAIYCFTDQFDLAEQHINEALTRNRNINMVDHEADILLDVARLRYAQGDFKDAQKKASEALVITERCGYVLQGADVNLFLAQYAVEQEKDKAKAKQYAEEAKRLATCDGPPYYYKVAYEEAERMLEKLK